MQIDEKQLDTAIEKTFSTSPEFSTWFLSMTKFNGRNASYLWSRSDNPWGKITADIYCPDENKVIAVTKESETDILVVYEDNNSQSRLAIHIENKLAGGKFEQYQPELYGPRAAKWQNQDKYRNYTEFTTVLVSPKSFFERNKPRATIFDTFISYESMASKVELISDYMNHTKSDAA